VQETRCFDALAELYSDLSEDDILYGLWKRRCIHEATRAGLSLVQHGYLEQAQNVFLDSMKIDTKSPAPNGTVWAWGPVGLRSFWCRGPVGPIGLGVLWAFVPIGLGVLSAFVPVGLGVLWAFVLVGLGVLWAFVLWTYIPLAREGLSYSCL